MSQRAFDLLCDNFEQTGITDPILGPSTCRPGRRQQSAKCSRAREPVQTFRIVGGHHRYDAAMYLGFEEVPVTVDHWTRSSTRTRRRSSSSG